MAVVGKFICSTAVAGGFHGPTVVIWFGLHKRSVTSSIMGPWDEVSCSGAAEGHPPNRCGDSIHVCDTHCLILHNAAGAHGHQSGDSYNLNSEWPRGYPRVNLWCLIFLQAGHHLLKATYWHCQSDNLQFSYWQGWFQ